MKKTVFWFRNDLRLSDNPALGAAAAGAQVLPVFVLDPELKLGKAKHNRLLESLRSLREQTNGSLVVRNGKPAEVIDDLARQVGAAEVHHSRDMTPFGFRREKELAEVLAGSGVGIVATGSPYAVAPGRILTNAQTPFRVFTPFSRAWLEHGWSEPLPEQEVAWTTVADRGELAEDVQAGAGEQQALARWTNFLADLLEGYAQNRDRPDLDVTSRISTALSFGEIHPRTLLADIADIRKQNPTLPSGDSDRFVTELAWREFYADVLWHNPQSAWNDLRPEMRHLEYDQDPEAFEAWCNGNTGYPFVDAGMRQLKAEGWMHNRLRMVVASFLVKDLHMWWPHGARYFMENLVDADLASNSHGWQWVAGTGTDAAPYFRIFNPVLQGLRFDPNGDYVRRWVPELRDMPGSSVHEPWKAPAGGSTGYPARIVDHAEERREALRRVAVSKELVR